MGAPSTVLNTMITPPMDGEGGERRRFSGKVEATFTRQKGIGGTYPDLMCSAALLQSGISKCCTGGMLALPSE
jgi:hypothetical protein